MKHLTFLSFPLLHLWKILHKFRATFLAYIYTNVTIIVFHFPTLKFWNPRTCCFISLYWCWFDTMHSPIYQINTGVNQCLFLRDGWISFRHHEDRANFPSSWWIGPTARRKRSRESRTIGISLSTAHRSPLSSLSDRVDSGFLGSVLGRLLQAAFIVPSFLLMGTSPSLWICLGAVESMSFWPFSALFVSPKSGSLCSGAALLWFS